MSALWVGANLSKAKGLVININEMIEMGGNSLQVFLSPPMNSSKGINLKESEIKTAQKLKGQFFIIIHGKYTLNFCRPRSATEWQFDCLKHDLGQANLIGADVIIHQGSNLKELGQTEDEAYQTFANNLMAILEETPELSNRIILENSCHEGTELGYTIEQLGRIFKLIEAKYRQRIGFCIDLCHIYVAGTCDLRQASEVDKMFDTFHQEIGLDYLKVIHFNDSRIPFDGRNDAHADLMVGHIGNPHLGGNSQGFQAVVKTAQKWHIPMILETPRKTNETSTEAQINLLRIWANGNLSQEEIYLNQNNIHMTMIGAEATKAKSKKLPKALAPAPVSELAPTAPAPTPASSKIKLQSIPLPKLFQAPTIKVITPAVKVSTDVAPEVTVDVAPEVTAEVSPELVSQSTKIKFLHPVLKKMN